MSVNDDKFKALGDQGFTGALAGRYLAWLKDNGASSNDVQDAEREFLTAQGFWSGPSQTVNGAWHAFLGSLGFTQGTLSGRRQAFWADGGNIGPPSAPTWDSAPTPAAPIVGIPYSYDMGQHLNTRQGITLTTQTGSLPAGLSYSGVNIVGVPTTAGNVTGIVTRATNATGNADSSAYAINVGANPNFPAWDSSPTPSAGERQTSYSYDLSTHANSAANLLYSIVTGTLPAGLSLNPSTGVISGTPTVVGNVTGLVCRIQNEFGNADSAAFAINIAENSATPVWNTTPTPGQGTRQVPYSYDLSVHTNSPPNGVYSIASGSLPPGLSLNPATGVISGTPTAFGTFSNVTISLGNSFGTAISNVFQIVVIENPDTPAWTSIPEPSIGQVGASYSYDFTAHSNNPPGSVYSVQVGTLPPGLTLLSNGLMQGTPTVDGTTSPITLRVSNSFGSDDSTPFTMTVNPAAAFTMERVRLDNPVQNSREVFDEGTETAIVGGDAAWEAVVAAAGMEYATDFSRVWLSGTIDPARAIADTNGLFAEAHSTPGDDKLDRSSEQFISGGAALRMWQDDTDGGGTPASWIFKCNGDRSGVISDGVSFPRQYVTFCLYLPLQTLAWRTPGSSSAKFWKAHVPTFSDGELLMVNQRSMGYPAMQANNPTDPINVTIDSAQNGVLFGDVLIYQPFGAEDAGETFDLSGIASANEIVEAYGPLGDRGGGEDDVFGQAGGDYTYISGQERLDQRTSIINNGGFPKAEANIRGQSFIPDDWQQFVIFTDFDNAGGPRVMVWTGRLSQTPKLIIDDVGTLKIPSSGTYAHMHQISYQKTSQSSEPGVRPTLYRYYDCVGLSVNPIPFINLSGDPIPLPNNPGGPTGSALEQAISALSAGQSSTVTSPVTTQSKNNLAWNAGCPYDPVRKRLYIPGKTAGSNGSWTLRVWDLPTDTIIDLTDEGPNSPGTWDDTGHAYDNWGIDITTGDLMCLRGNSKQPFIRRAATGAWEQITRGGWPTSAHADGCAHHPNAYGPGDGAWIACTSRSIWFRRDSTEQWIEEFNNVPPSGSHSTGIGIYHEVSDAVFVKGSDSSNPIYRITPGPTLSTRGIPSSSGAVKAGGQGSFSTSGNSMTVLPHPDGTSKLVGIENWDGQNRWWESDDDANSWTLGSGKLDLNGPDNGNGNGDVAEGGPFFVLAGGLGCVRSGLNRIEKLP